jgi:hypothetical protein
MLNNLHAARRHDAAIPTSHIIDSRKMGPDRQPRENSAQTEQQAS